jgi:hypothetical protein
VEREALLRAQGVLSCTAWPTGGAFRILPAVSAEDSTWPQQSKSIVLEAPAVTTGSRERHPPARNSLHTLIDSYALPLSLCFFITSASALSLTLHASQIVSSPGRPHTLQTCCARSLRRIRGLMLIISHLLRPTYWTRKKHER